MNEPRNLPLNIVSACRDATDRRIVELVAEGLADKEIAAHVFLSPQTVRNRISHILCSSGARNRTQLAVSYIRDTNTPTAQGGGHISR